MLPCMYCKKQPRLVEISDLFYVQCSCGKWNPNDFVGISRRTAIEQWNHENIQRPKNTPKTLKHSIKKPYKNYIYIVNGKGFDIVSLAKYVDTTKKYIRTKFRRENSDVIVLKGFKIERKIKEFRHGEIPDDLHRN